jgi:hypothetical protein
MNFGNPGDPDLRSLWQGADSRNGSFIVDVNSVAFLRSCTDPLQVFALRKVACFEAMLCPFCNKFRSRVFWKDSQWVARNPRIHDFRCCKACDPGGILPSDCKRVMLGNAVCELKDTLRLCRPAIRFHIGRFIMQWMFVLPKDERKFLSYFGAIRRRSGFLALSDQATPWELDTQLKWKVLPETDYFDPTNHTYLFAFRLLFGDFWASCCWNKETCGDIFESILGFVWLANSIGHESLPASRLAAFFDSVIHSVWAILLVTELWRDFDIFAEFVRNNVS